MARMASQAVPSLFARLRHNRGLRLLFSFMALLWVWSATACALHDLRPDCQFTSHAAEPHHDMGEATGDDPHVPCCPHPLSMQPPLVDSGVSVVMSSVLIMAPSGLSARSYISLTHSPPTPPPKFA
jgi:hypothetical protein